jgi:phospholipid/cholesterol/gamma-HCH transport system permease protein
MELILQRFLNTSEKFGRSLFDAWNGIKNFVLFVASIADSFRHIRKGRFRPIKTIILNQTRFTGVDALPFVFLVALLVGGTSIIQAMTNLPRFGVQNYFGNVMVIIIARELGPLITALIVISRSGSAMAAEVALQKWSREILSLETMGIDPRIYIVFPRIIATIIAIFSLIVFFDIIAFFGGYFIAQTLVYIPIDVFFSNLLFSFDLRDLLATVIKSLIFGFIIPLVSCYYGFMPTSKFEVPIFVRQAVSRTLLSIMVINAVISVIFYFSIEWG